MKVKNSGKQNNWDIMRKIGLYFILDFKMKIYLGFP